MSAFAGSFNITTAAATNTVAVTGVGFTPTALILWWSGRTESTDAAGGGSATWGIGFCAGTTSRCCVTSFNTDAVTTSAIATNVEGDQCIMLNTSGEGNDGKADLSAFDADGFTMVIDTQFGVDLRISFLALGGDISSAAANVFGATTSTGEQAVTGVGFQPECVLFIGGGRNGTVDQSTADLRLSFGAAVGASNEWAMNCFEDNAASTSNAQHYAFGDECFADPNSTGGPSLRGEFVSFGADGFTVNLLEVGGAERWTGYLALAGGSYDVGDILTAADTNNFSTTGIGFTPVGVLYSSVCHAENTQDTSANDVKFSIGAASGAAERTAQAMSSDNGETTMEVFTAIEHDEVYIRPDLADGVEGLMDLVTLDADGFTNVMDDADPDAAFVGYIAFGDSTGSAGANRRKRASSQAF